MFELGVTFNIERGEGGKLFFGAIKASVPSYVNAVHSNFDQACRKNRVIFVRKFFGHAKFWISKLSSILLMAW